MRTQLIILTTITGLLLYSEEVNCQISQEKEVTKKFQLRTEYITPSSPRRQIETIFFNALYGWDIVKTAPVSFNTGITATYAWGNIVVKDSSNEKETLQNSAFGIGPVFFFSYEPRLYGNWTIAPEFSGGIVFYTEPFPAGGDIYNFVWRFGASLNYKFPNRKYTFILSANWVHVSNGQNFTDKNPSYEGYGVGMSFIKYLNEKK
jgi:lipid A 3-O-deacylase